MKNIINKVFQLSMLALTLFAFKACVVPEDLVTEDAKSGGLVIPVTSNVPYKLNATPSVDVDISVPKGPGITSVEVHNVFTTVDGESSNDVILTTLNVASGNTSADVDQSLSVTYADLISGLTVGGNPLPTVEGDLSIGDYWTLSYVSVMADGRRVVNNGTTGIGVANQYAGTYIVTGVFHHPTAGDRDINEEKYLTPIDAYSCYTDLGDLGSAGYDITILVNADNSVFVSVGPNQVTDVFMSPGEENSFTPATGVFVLNYYYVGASGPRIIDEVYTPE